MSGSRSEHEEKEQKESPILPESTGGQTLEGEEEDSSPATARLAGEMGAGTAGKGQQVSGEQGHQKAGGKEAPVVELEGRQVADRPRNLTMTGQSEKIPGGYDGWLGRCLACGDAETAEEALARIEQEATGQGGKKGEVRRALLAKVWSKAGKYEIKRKSLHWLAGKIPLREALEFFDPSAELFQYLTQVDPEFIDELSQDEALAKRWGRTALKGAIRVKPGVKTATEMEAIWGRLLNQEEDRSEPALLQYREMYLVDLFQNAVQDGHDNWAGAKWLLALGACYKKTPSQWLHMGLVSMEYGRKGTSGSLEDRIRALIDYLDLPDIDWAELAKGTPTVARITQAIKGERDKERLDRELPRAGEDKAVGDGHPWRL